MAYGGYEKDRECLKYLCPARHYGYKCGNKGLCKAGKHIRININDNRRIFTPVARSSHKWKSIYKKRTSVKRVNSRLDVSFGFERHFIRGIRKMKTKCAIALRVMLAIALGRVREGKAEVINEKPC